MNGRALLKRGAIGLAALLRLIQLVPYGRDHANPPATKQATFAAPGGQQLFDGACADCHSNQTKWLWYANVAPGSWLVQNDVDGGRSSLNLSEWDKPQPELDEIVETIDGGEMPPWQYRLAPNHSEARMSAAEKRKLIEAFRQLYRTDSPPVRTEDGG